MQEDREYVYQCKLFCYFRYEFFKRSSSYTLVQDIRKTTWQNKNPEDTETMIAGILDGIRKNQIFFDEIEEAARHHSSEALKAVKLNDEYCSFGQVSGATVFVMDDGNRIEKRNRDLTIFDNPYLMAETINIPISMKEALTIDVSIETIKARIQKHFRENFPTAIGIPERMKKPDGTLAAGKFLPFEKWKRCLHSYDEKAAGKSISEIGRAISKLWPGRYDDPSNSYNKIKREIKEAERLIESAANGTFPH